MNNVGDCYLAIAFGYSAVMIIWCVFVKCIPVAVFDVSPAETDALLVSNVTGGPCGTVDLKEIGTLVTGEGTNSLPIRDTGFS